MINIEKFLESASDDNFREALSLLLRPHFSPVFGAAKQIEHEVAALKALKLLGAIEKDADEYELVSKLGVTKSKARSLLYQVGLRGSMTPEDMDLQLKVLLTKPTVALDGEMVLIEIAQPLLMDVLRSRIRKLGYLSDGSFSGSVARVPIKAVAALVIHYLDDSERIVADKQLRSQDIPGSDLHSLVIGFLRKLGESAAGAAGEQVGNKLGEGINTIFDLARSKLNVLLNKVS